MKAITNFWYSGTPVLVEGYIEKGRFIVTDVNTEKTPDVNTDDLNSLHGNNGFGGCAFRSDEINGEYLSTFYLLETEDIKMEDKKTYSDVVVVPDYSSSFDEMPSDKSDEMNDLIFGKNNW